MSLYNYIDKEKILSKNRVYTMNIKKVQHFYLNKYIVSPFAKRKYYLCYNFTYKALWFRVAKVSSRTIDQHFRENTPEGAYVYSSEVGYMPSMYVDFFKFAFVRNPVDRFISAWKNKVLQANYFEFSEQKHHDMKDLSNFVSWVETLDVSKCDEHLRLQTTLIDLNHIDFIGRFERFGEDFQYLANQIGLPVKEIHHKNKSIGYGVELNEDLHYRIKQIYLKDYLILFPEKDANVLKSSST